jgi:hypothetical protein
MEKYFLLIGIGIVKVDEFTDCYCDMIGEENSMFYLFSFFFSSVFSCNND